MKKCLLIFLLNSIILAVNAQQITWKNRWANSPSGVPYDGSIDAPLMGNGDVTMSVGYKQNVLRYYLSKNDFWRLISKADGLSGPRSVGFVDVSIEGFNDDSFYAEQSLKNGITTCTLKKNDQKLVAKSWVSATSNLIFLEFEAIDKPVKISFNLATTGNKQAKVESGKQNGCYWQTNAFVDSVDIATEVAVALKSINYGEKTITLQPARRLIIAVAVESKFKNKEPLKYVLTRLDKIDVIAMKGLMGEHEKWWTAYWKKSSVQVEDSVLMKAYHQGLYTMAACSRDPKFPPGIFGWTTTDKPLWNGDYHLNYNFQAPFYALYASNRLEQGAPHDAPLLDFIPRGEWYAQNVTKTRGILYPVGIGPLGIEVTRDFPTYEKEAGGLFFGQRSNAAYGLLNMAQQWRCTYSQKYGKKIYPYALDVVNFWEDYLKFENGRYVIYGDAIHEGSGKDKNPILSLGLVRNAFDLIIDLSSSLKIDESRQAKWKDILNKLSDFPVQVRNGKRVFRYTEEGVAWWNDNGLGIQNIYPANSITADSKDELLTVARNTIDEMKRWQDFNTSSSFYVAAIRVGYNPEVILDELHKYALHTYPNGFQFKNPHGIENSCTVANALNEMLCMSVGNVIRLFNIPKGQNASFENIRTWGAFLVSASLRDGIISDVKIKSEQGRNCTIVNPWSDGKVQLIRNGKKAEVKEGSRISFTTSVSETVVLRRLL